MHKLTTGKTLAWLHACLLVCCSTFSSAQAQASSVPKLSTYVTDQTDTLDQAQRQALETRLRSIDERSGSQVAVLIVPTTGLDSIERYAIAVAEANAIGRKKVDDGILVVVAKEDRKARIEVGYGLEGAVPDIVAGRIIREYMTPKFRVNDYAGGLNDAVGVLESAIDGEQLSKPTRAQDKRADGGGLSGNWVIALFFAFFAANMARGIFSKFSLGARVLLGAGAGAVVAWLLSSLLWVAGAGGVIGLLIGAVSSAGGRYARHRDWGGFGGGGGWGGGGWGGGGSSGGFSGGGGSFGGGGASGSW